MIPANRKITKTLLRKLASVYDRIEIDPSPIRLWGIEPRELASCFPEMRPYIGDCRYNDCRHMSEPGCRIQAVTDAGVIQPDRLESYRILLQELEGAPEEWE